MKNMKKKALLSSVLTIVLCLSLIAGSTFALFTSESKVDVAVTSGTVNVTAEILTDTLATSSMGVAQKAGSFENGGTAIFDDNAKLNLTAVTPGDAATFQIKMTNHSDVAVQYRVKWAIDGKLSEVLVAEADGNKIVNNTSDWTEWTTEEATEKLVNVSLELPVEVDDNYEDETAAITFVVEAVQGNAIVEDVASYEQLWAALEMGVENISLTDNVTLPEGTVLTVKEGSAITMNLGAYTLTGTSHNSAGAVLTNKGTLTITGGTIKSTAPNGGSAIQNNGTLTVNGTTLNGASAEGGSWPSYTVNNTGVMTVKDAMITSVHGAVASYGANAILTLENTDIDMSGIPGMTSHGIYTYSNGKVVVKGGNIANHAADQNSTGASVINGDVTIYSGNFAGRLENYYGKSTIYGGTFTELTANKYTIPEHFEAVNNGNGTWSVQAKAGVDVVENAEDLKNTLKDAGAAGAGDSTVFLMGDIDMTGEAWTPIKVDGYHGADIVTVEGNGAVIRGLSAPLFQGGFAGGSGIVIKNLTIADSNIVSANTQGSGAFIECVDSMDVITLTNCHLLDSTVSGSRTGGLVGWTSGYNNVNDGAVKTYVTVTDCSVKNCEITGTSVGAIFGHAGANAWTFTTVENCVIENNKLHSTDDGDWRVGVVVGTANIGEVTINNVTETNNTLTQVGKTAPEGQSNLYGRFVPSDKNGKLVIDGVHYVATPANLAEVLTSDAKTISVVLTKDVTVPISSLGQITGGSGEYKLGGEDTETITIDLNNHKLTITTTYWSAIGAKNPNATITIKNGSMTSTGNSAGTWNGWDLRFCNCDWTFENVHFEKAVALDNAGKTTMMTNVKITDDHNADTYALWITAEGQEVIIDGLTVDMSEATDGRGIKIDNQYVDQPEKVTLKISNASFITEEKAAILVKSPAGADIVLSNVDIANTIDTVHAVWVDGDSAAYASLVSVTGCTCIVEP